MLGYNLSNLKTKHIHVFVNGHNIYKSFFIHPKCRQGWSAILDCITKKLRPTFGAIRNLRTADGKHSIDTFEDLEHEGVYVACGNEPFRTTKEGYILYKEKTKDKINEYYPTELLSSSDQKKYPCLIETMKKGRTLIYVFANGKKVPKKVVLIKSDYENWDKLLNYFAKLLDIPEGVKGMYTVFGQPLCGPNEIQHGGYYVAIPFNSHFKQIKYLPPRFSNRYRETSPLVNKKDYISVLKCEKTLQAIENRRKRYYRSRSRNKYSEDQDALNAKMFKDNGDNSKISSSDPLMVSVTKKQIHSRYSQSPEPNLYNADLNSKNLESLYKIDQTEETARKYEPKLQVSLSATNNADIELKINMDESKETLSVAPVETQTSAVFCEVKFGTENTIQVGPNSFLIVHRSKTDSSKDLSKINYVSSTADDLLAPEKDKQNSTSIVGLIINPTETDINKKPQNLEAQDQTEWRSTRAERKSSVNIADASILPKSTSTSKSKSNLSSSINQSKYSSSGMNNSDRKSKQLKIIEMRITSNQNEEDIQDHVNSKVEIKGSADEMMQNRDFGSKSNNLNFNNSKQNIVKDIHEETIFYNDGKDNITETNIKYKSKEVIIDNSDQKLKNKKVNQKKSTSQNFESHQRDLHEADILTPQDINQTIKNFNDFDNNPENRYSNQRIKVTSSKDKYKSENNNPKHSLSNYETIPTKDYSNQNIKIDLILNQSRSKNEKINQEVELQKFNNSSKDLKIKSTSKNEENIKEKRSIEPDIKDRSNSKYRSLDRTQSHTNKSANKIISNTRIIEQNGSFVEIKEISYKKLPSLEKFKNIPESRSSTGASSLGKTFSFKNALSNENHNLDGSYASKPLVNEPRVLSGQLMDLVKSEHDLNEQDSFFNKLEEINQQDVVEKIKSTIDEIKMKLEKRLEKDKT